MYIPALLLIFTTHLQPPSPWPPLWMGGRLSVLGRWWPTRALWSREVLSLGLLLQCLRLLLCSFYLLTPLVVFGVAVMPHPQYSVLSLTIGPPSQVLVLLTWMVWQTWPPPSCSLPELSSMGQWWIAVLILHLTCLPWITPSQPTYRPNQVNSGKKTPKNIC